MHVHINGAIFNMDKYDYCQPKKANRDYPNRIAFYRDGQENEYAAVKSEEELDRLWRTMVQRVSEWY